MKLFSFLLATTLYVTAAFSQKPERILGNARVQKSISYYKQQSAAWKKLTEQNPKDADAWYNYFYANRILTFNDTTDSRSMEERDNDLQKIVKDMEKNIPETYEYNLCKFALGGNDLKLVPYLKKAAALGEGRTEHLDYMINISEMERNISDRDLYCKKKFDAGLLSTGMMYYNYNVIMGLAPNAILITSGDNDTYPVWALQAQGIRKDILVINTYLIHIDEYRKRVFKELGLEDKETFLQNISEKDYNEKFNNEIIPYLVENKKNYPLYVALTTAGCVSYIGGIQENLYLTGLTYQYSKVPVDNIALLKRNFEQGYALDYIDKPFYLDVSQEVVNMINGNYIIPMLKLYDHYKIAGDKQKESWIKDKLLLVCKGTESESEVKKMITAE